MKKLIILTSAIAIAFLIIGGYCINYSDKLNEHLEGRWYKDFDFYLMKEDFNYSSDDKIHLHNFVFYYDFTQNKGSISFDLKDKNWSLSTIRIDFPSVIVVENIYTTKIGNETYKAANIDAKISTSERYDDLRKINYTNLRIFEFNTTFNDESFVIEFRSSDLKPKGWFGFWYDPHNRLHSGIDGNVNFVLGDRYECTGACVYDLNNIEETPNSFVRNLKLNFIKENQYSSFKLDGIDRHIKWRKTLFMGLGFFFMGVSSSIIASIIGLLYKERKGKDY